MKINPMNTNVQATSNIRMEAQSSLVQKGEQVENFENSKKVSKVEMVQKSNDESLFEDEVLKKSVEQANKNLEGYNRTIERSVHSVTHTVMYTVKDTKTGDVIAEFPPRKIQDMIAKMWEIAGLVVDEKA
ncbi:flagellar protein FlaG [Fusibacter ferrireducens]|uniref:Flagellar protein FlaG n=1 Tax=Fusibacter ferrireducens TaxID=2785058 RepID=A0ABR9ZXB0_9FIRM|nr:flagellar protein FlaG [Fusibacter ferrireducens]MBF4694500.1 flagellar protein FlaG [Fusibacter ferrireducens]